MIKRAHDFGVRKFLFAGGYLHDALDSYTLALNSDDFYCTIGVHPCRALEPFKKSEVHDGHHSYHDHAKFEEDKKAAESLSLVAKQELLQAYLAKIDEVLSTSARKEKFVAIGECGLDYDRFEYADQASQLL